MINPKRNAALLACLALLSCGPEKIAGGAGAGNPPQADVSVSMLASSGADPVLRKAGAMDKASGAVIRNPDGTFLVADSAGNALTLSAIEIRIQKMEFALPEGVTCEGLHAQLCEQNEVVVKGPYNMDLMTGNSTPGINFIKLPQGSYTRIGLELPEMGDITAPEDTVATNMVIRGVLGNPGLSSGRHFELKLNLSNGLEFTDSVGIRITATSLNKLVLSLLVDGWFQGTDMRSCLDGAARLGGTRLLPADSSGIIQIVGDTACSGLGLRIRRNVEASSDVHNEEEPEIR